MCACGIRVTLKDGEVRSIQGNPDHPLNKVLCAKGASGIMKQHSPARLTKPLLRKPGTARGEGKCNEISWGAVFDIMAKRPGKIREEGSNKFAIFTGRDQVQALTGVVREAVRRVQLRGAWRIKRSGSTGKGAATPHCLGSVVPVDPSLCSLIHSTNYTSCD